MPEPSNPRHRRPARAESGGRQGQPAVTYLDPSYTTNLCPNPGCEVSIAGWTATDLGVTLAQTNLVSLYGSQSLQVTTSGSIPGQGVIGPQGVFPGLSGLCSLTTSIWGSAGTVLVSFVNARGGQAMASEAVVLDGSGWQTIIFANASFPANALMYVLFQTVGPEAITFNVDGTMYQPEGTPHPYVDGDQPQCFWTGTAELSTSYQSYQYAIGGSLGFWLGGYCNVVVPGEVIPVTLIPVLEFFVDPLAGATASVATIAGALTDFGIWTSADPDPAQTYGWWTNAGTLSSQTAYTQIYGMVVPPLDYPVSGGSYAWRRAAYAAVGFSWAAVPNATEQILTDVQLQHCHTSTIAATTPSAFQRPRQLQVIIKPSRLNYITNPAFQNGTAGWTQDGTGVTMSVNPSLWPPSIATYDNLPYGAFQSCQVTLNSAADQGIQISVPFLIPGETYMASCYVMTTSNGLADILGACGGGAADVAGLIEPQFSYGGAGVSGYGAGPYGGIIASNTPLPTGVWTRLSFTFVAAGDTQTFFITASYLGGASSVITPLTYPQSFFVTGVLIETGDILMPYFDGNSGQDALWEYSGGTTSPQPNGGTSPGLSRSYYYTQLKFGQSIVNQTLQSNTPLGISYATPLYATPPNS